MPHFSFAKVSPDPANPGAQQVSISAQAATILVALIGIVPALTTGLTTYFTTRQSASASQEVQRADANVKNQQVKSQAADTAMKIQQNESEWLKLALALDDNKRKAGLDFLVKTGLVSDSNKTLATYLMGTTPPQMKAVKP